MARILVVDDRPINREFLVTLLGYGQHEILQAADGAEALGVARANRPDLVITDVLMPVMDGAEFVRRLRADPALAGIPVIFYTATYRLGDAWQLAHGCGVDTVLGKPSSPEAIFDAVAAKLGERARPPSLRPAALPAAAATTGLPRLQQHLCGLGDWQLVPAPDAVQQSLRTVTTLSLRLAAVLELGFELAGERDLDRLLAAFVRAARDILNVRYAAAGLGDGNGGGRLAASGLPADVVPLLAAAADGPFGTLLADGRPRRLPGDEAAGMLPAGHPPVRTLLALPLCSPTRRYGWLYFADKLGSDDFSDEDEQIASILAAKLLLACENLLLFAETQRYAGELELEVAARRQHEARIARLNRVLAVLSQINSAIVRIRQRPALFAEACRIAVEDGQFALAWIGRRDGDRLLPLVWQSRAGGASPPRSIRLAEAAGPTGGLGCGHVSVCADLQLCCADDSGVDAAASRQLRSRAVLALRENGAVVGAMVLYAEEVGFFDADEVRLLNELAGDLSFALDYIAGSERLNYLAYYDALTGLPNRSLFLDRVGQLLHGAARDGSMVALVVLDIAHFRQVNDGLGRHVGDALLQALAERLTAAVREPCSIARAGADRYAIALGGLPVQEASMTLLRERIFAVLRPPFATAGGEVSLDARAGLALYPGDGDDAELLLAHAEAALAQAKQTGDRHAYYDREVNARNMAKVTLGAELRQAIEQDEFVLHYQPKLSLQTGRIVGAEALIRWRHPERGLVVPASFIPLAEESGLIAVIGEWVLRRVCAQQASWLAACVDVVPVAVNLSAVQFRAGNVVGLVREALATAGLDAKHLELELTESVLMHDPDRQVLTLKALRQMGVGLALDDFGTGYSSLAYLKRYPFNSVKIDRAFITELTHNPEDAAIADAAIGIARRLGMKTVAEGVESEGQLHYLCRLGCDEMQGYLFSRPVPPAEFAALLGAGRRLTLPAGAQAELRTLLLVDDEPNILQALRRLFRADGYRILTAGSGREGLDRLAENDVQVIVSDQRMSGMSGAEFLSAARELYPDTIRIILSGYTDISAVTEAVNRGAVFKFLTKPWNDDLLRENIRDAFRRYRPQPAAAGR